MWKLVVISQAIFGLYLLSTYVNGVSRIKNLQKKVAHKFLCLNFKNSNIATIRPVNFMQILLFMEQMHNIIKSMMKCGCEIFKDFHFE